MQKAQMILRQGLAVLLLWPFMTGCDGSSSSAQAATSSSTSVASQAPASTTTASAGNSSTSSSSGSGTSGSAGTTTVLFEQPEMGGIAGNFFVPFAVHKSPPTGAFSLILWQPNRFQSNGQLVATAWDAGGLTGFTPSLPASAQLGFQNRAGTSTAQMEGGTVGAYINSADLPPSTADQTMMITPQFIFPSGNQPMPFAHSQGSLSGSMDLQVPVAVGSDAYILADLLFESASGVRISYGIKIFRNGGGGNAVVGFAYASDSNTYQVNSPIGSDGRFVTPAAGGASAASTPWSGWRHFAWSISQAQFVSALQELTKQFPGKVTVTDPAQYVLAEVHLNAEFHTQGKPAQLGWSMRGLTLWTTP
jgi:hypothetical protein